jgi:hypothetical protein
MEIPEHIHGVLLAIVFGALLIATIIKIVEDE